MPNNIGHENQDPLVKLIKDLYYEEAIHSLNIDDLDEIHRLMDAYLHYDAMDNDEQLPSKDEIKEALVKIASYSEASLEAGLELLRPHMTKEEHQSIPAWSAELDVEKILGPLLNKYNLHQAWQSNCQMIEIE